MTKKKHLWPFIVSLLIAFVIVVFANISIYRLIMLQDLGRPYNDESYLDKATEMDDVFLDRLHYLLSRWIVGPSYRDTHVTPAQMGENLWLEILDHDNKQKIMAGTDENDYRLKLATKLFVSAVSGNMTSDEVIKAAKRVIQAMGSERTLHLERFMASYIGFPQGAKMDRLRAVFENYQAEFENFRSRIPEIAFQLDVMWTKYEITHRPGICESCLRIPTDVLKMLEIYRQMFHYKIQAYVPAIYLTHWTGDDFTSWSYMFSPIMIGLCGCLIYFTIAKYTTSDYT